jgi:hypothetical protein
MARMSGGGEETVEKEQKFQILEARVSEVQP